MNIVFVLANPKEGTKYMTHVLAPLAKDSQGCVLHEPDCYVGWEVDIKTLRSNPGVLETFNNGNSVLVKKLWKIKLESIKKNYGKHKLYFESDFRFMMLWCEYAAMEIPNLKVVCMHRPIELIVRSLSWYGFYTSKGDGGHGHGSLLQPHKKLNLTVPTGREDAVQKAIWHTYEINERKKLFLRRHRKRLQVFHFNLITDRTEVVFRNLMDFLEVPVCDEVLDYVRRDPIVNTWLKKPKFKHLATLEEIRDRVNNYKIEYTTKGRKEVLGGKASIH